MDFGLDPFLYADSVFYDSIDRADDRNGAIDAATLPPPPGWLRAERSEWVSFNPPDFPLPNQGWKVHVTARPENAVRIAQVVRDYCVDRLLPFKLLRNQRHVLVRSSKYAPRSASGKFATIYPADEPMLERTLRDLDERLAGETGPYILSDLRWGDGPLYVRYGGFRERFRVGESGELEHAIQDPDGNLHADTRGPTFELPPWVSLPQFLAPHLDASHADGGGELPYRVVEALHFSNGGGVYLADRLTDGARVVLKEARPWSGLDATGRDAVARLRSERWALQQVAGIPGVPAYYDYLTVGEHEFVVEEFIAGEPISGWLSHNNPLATDVDPSASQLAEYSEQALRIHHELTDLIRRIHDRGLTFGDLHPGNIVVTPDGSVALIDFELARPLDDPDAPGLQAHGFVDGRLVGAARDRRALASLGLWLFLPLTPVLTLAPENGADYVDSIAARFTLPADFLDVLRQVFGEATPDSPAARGARRVVSLRGPAVDWPAARRSMAAAILLSASPDRNDRLFPGGIDQFITSSPGFANGAGGVLWALAEAGCGRYPDYEDWLMDSLGRIETERLGFYEGLHGLSYLADYFDRPELASKLLERAVAGTAAIRSVDLHGGLAGAGLNLIHFAAQSGDAELTGQAQDVADRIAHGFEVTDARDPVPPPEGSAGLMYGWSGTALFLTRLAHHTGESDYLDLAVGALHRDLDQCLTLPNGSLQADAADGRALPYLGVGSAGIALVIDEVLECRADDRLQASLSPLLRACQTELFAQPDLFTGRAGTLAALNRAGARLDRAQDLRCALTRQLSRLEWHAVSYRGHLAFPGERSLRLSMDLATGVAGVLLSVHAATAERAGFLPFFGPRKGWCGRGRAAASEGGAPR